MDAFTEGFIQGYVVGLIGGAIVLNIWLTIRGRIKWWKLGLWMEGIENKLRNYMGWKKATRRLYRKCSILKRQQWMMDHPEYIKLMREIGVGPFQAIFPDIIDEVIKEYNNGRIRTRP